MHFKAGSAHTRDFSSEFLNQPRVEIEGDTAVTDAVVVSTAETTSPLTE
jgi:hypothetical protein